MTARPVRMVLLALGLAVLAGGTVGALSQMTAVSTLDPRPSTPPLTTPTPIPTPTSAPTPTPTPAATATAAPEQGGEAWLYTMAAGDSLSRIAIRFGTTTEDILTLNPEYADNQDLIEIGSPMILPCTPIAAAEDRC